MRVDINFFRLIFFFDLIIQHWFFFFKLGFMIIFAFLFIRLSQYHNLTRGFIRLTRRAWAFFGLKLLFFFYPFVWFFFNFIIQHLISWKLSFVVFSNLVILAKWLRSWVLWINMGWHRSFFSLFFLFHHWFSLSLKDVCVDWTSFFLLKEKFYRSMAEHGPII